jgi:hypothetical protein
VCVIQVFSERDVTQMLHSAHTECLKTLFGDARAKNFDAGVTRWWKLQEQSVSVREVMSFTHMWACTLHIYTLAHSLSLLHTHTTHILSLSHAYTHTHTYTGN